MGSSSINNQHSQSSSFSAGTQFSLQSPLPHQWPNRPVFKRASLGSNLSSQDSAGSSANVKVVLAAISRSSGGKLNFTKQKQTYIPVKEATATVPYITSVVRETWGPHNVLVTADGLKLQDGPGTQGG